MTSRRDDEAAFIESLYRGGLAAVEPRAAVRRHAKCQGNLLILGGHTIAVSGQLIIVAVGKAAVPMAQGVQDVCGDLVSGGFVLTKDGHATDADLHPLELAEAAHPVPDERGVEATNLILNLLGGLDQNDVVLTLISGGGSALLEAPRAPLTLADLQSTTDLLLRAGAPIQDLNTVRRQLSRVKGGGLREAAWPATMATLILSDVLGNDPSVIASGPTVRGTTTADDAVAVLERYGLWDRVSPDVMALLADGSGDDGGGIGQDAGNSDPWGSEAGRTAVRPDHANPHAEDDIVVVVGDNMTFVDAVAASSREAGRPTLVIWREREGEAAVLGRAWVEACSSVADETDVLVGGGEATVTVRGDGTGGRNTEFALAAALALAEQDDRGWVVASLASDGQDGPTDVAGAIADGQTVDRARAAGIDPVRALRENDSLAVFQAAGGVVAPGPTGTNVNDLYVAVRRR